jgi:hypothetical protein
MAADPLLPSPGWLFGNRVSWEGLTEELQKEKCRFRTRQKRKHILQTRTTKADGEKNEFYKKLLT